MDKALRLSVNATLRIGEEGTDESEQAAHDTATSQP